MLGRRYVLFRWHHSCSRSASTSMTTGWCQSGILRSPRRLKAQNLHVSLSNLTHVLALCARVFDPLRRVAALGGDHANRGFIFDLRERRDREIPVVDPVYAVAEQEGPKGAEDAEEDDERGSEHAL